MTLDELKKIDSAASSAAHLREKLRDGAKSLSELRTSSNPISASDKVGAIKNRFSYGGMALANAEFFAVLEEFLPEILRIAELRLEAKARAAGASHRLLTEQVRSFFDEETKAAGSKQ